MDAIMTRAIVECSTNLQLAAMVIHDYVYQVLLASVVINDCAKGMQTVNWAKSKSKFNWTNVVELIHTCYGEDRGMIMFAEYCCELLF